MINLGISITCYNSEKTINRCLDSFILFSSEKNPIVIVNDGSTDNSKKILMEYAQKHNNIRLINFETNQGVTIARKTSILENHADYIAIIDIDDEFYSNPFAIFDKLKRDNFMYDIFEFNAVNHNNVNINEFNRKTKTFFSNELIKQYFVFNDFKIPLWYRIYKRGLFSESVFNLNEKKVDDGPALPIIFSRSKSYKKIEIPLIKHYFLPNSLSANKKNMNIEYKYEMLSKYYFNQLFHLSLNINELLKDRYYEFHAINLLIKYYSYGCVLEYQKLKDIREIRKKVSLSRAFLKPRTIMSFKINNLILFILGYRFGFYIIHLKSTWIFRKYFKIG